MTLGGLALGIGMLVDNSIVVLENIYRLREGGREPLRGRRRRHAQEVTAAVMASTLTTVVVFLPLVVRARHVRGDVQAAGLSWSASPCCARWPWP